MIVQGLLKMIQTCEIIGSFDVQSGRRRKRTDLTVVEEVATAIKESRGGVKPWSARKIVRALDMAVCEKHKILRNILHCYPYKLRHVQELFPYDLPARETFAIEFLACMKVNKESPCKILRTGEALLHLTGYTDKQSYRIWATEKNTQNATCITSFCKDSESLRHHLSYGHIFF